MFFTRLAAAATACAILIAAVIYPAAPAGAGAHLAALGDGFQRGPLADKACPLAGSIITQPFADLADVLSVSPLGGVTAPGEALPAPFIRINTRKGATAFERRTTRVMAPARADITAIERRILRDATGAATGQSWTVHLRTCENVAIQLGDLDTLLPDLVRRAGGVAAFTQIDGPDHSAVRTQLRVRAGAEIGTADGFDVALIDTRQAAKDLVRPERYRTNPYLAGRVLGVTPELLSAIALDHTQAQCPLDYLPTRLRTEWTQKLGDVYGMRRAKGENACRTALADIPDTAQGAWFTDASHNGVATRLRAIALAPDSVDPQRQIFALHGRLRSFSPDLVALTPKAKSAREAAAQDFLSFAAAPDGRSHGRINQPFGRTEAGRIYCYQGLRANFVGPRINGVLLFEVSGKQEDRAPATMKMELRGDVQSCIDLPEPWAFTGAETLFYR